MNNWSCPCQTGKLLNLLFNWPLQTVSFHNPHALQEALRQVRRLCDCSQVHTIQRNGWLPTATATCIFVSSQRHSSIATVQCHCRTTAVNTRGRCWPTAVHTIGRCWPTAVHTSGRCRSKTAHVRQRAQVLLKDARHMALLTAHTKTLLLRFKFTLIQLPFRFRCANTHTRIHTRIHTHTHTYTHTRARERVCARTHTLSLSLSLTETFFLDSGTFALIQ